MKRLWLLILCLFFTALFMWGFVDTVVEYEFIKVMALVFVFILDAGLWREYLSVPIKDVYSPAGLLLGYRIIFYTGMIYTPFQSPFMRHFIWRPGWNRADNWHHPHAPDAGLYSYKKNNRQLMGLLDRELGVVVEVELGGGISVHERGYRSEYARVVRVLGDKTIGENSWGQDSTRYLEEQCAARYFDVPVERV